MKMIIDWLMDVGPTVVMAYVIYVVIAACAFGVYLWHRVWRAEDETRFDVTDIGHHTAD